MTDQTCTQCDNFEPHPDHDRFGWCKMEPPVLIGSRIVEGEKIIGIFQNPTTASTSFCSHWSGE